MIGHIDDELLVAGTDDHEGGVYEYSEDDGLSSRKATCLADYLEKYRDALLSNQLEFVEECGMMEKCGGPAVPSVGAANKK